MKEIEELKEKIEKLEIELEEEVGKKDEYRRQADSFWENYQDSEKEVERLEEKIEDMLDIKNIDSFSEEIFESNLTSKPVYIWDYKFQRVYITTKIWT